MRHILALLTLMTLLPLAHACSDTGEEPGSRNCQFKSDCVTDKEFCDPVSNMCTAYECTKDTDCSSDKRCNMLSNTCVRRSNTNNTNTSGTNSTTPTSSTNSNVSNTTILPTNTGQTGTDKMPPVVTTISPEQGSVVEPDVVWTITFNEVMDPSSLSKFSISLENLNTSQDLEIEVNYTSGTLAVTVKPVAPLALAGRYRLKLSELIRDESGNRFEAREIDFFTKYTPDAKAQAIAKKWAPVVYQGIENATPEGALYDLPTRVDFDADWNAANNLERINQSKAGASAYYHVTRSKTHTFIYYFFYYPARALRDPATGKDTYFEHDLTGAVFVVEDATEKLVFVEGVSLNKGLDRALPYFEDSSGYSGGQIKGKYKISDLEDGRSYPLYIPERLHEPCNWNDNQVGDLYCQHESREFLKGKANGLVLRAGDVAGTYATATDDANGLKTTTYQLLAFEEVFWFRRGSFGPDALFNRGSVYSPDGERPKGPGDKSLLIPVSLSSEMEQSFGVTPYQWLEGVNKSNAGQWLIDPAWTMTRRYSIPNKDTSWSQDYCVNLFLGIDQRGKDASCP